MAYTSKIELKKAAQYWKKSMFKKFLGVVVL